MSETDLNRKFIETAKLLNVYLNHFPKAEKYALANRIRNTAYEVYDLISEGQKRYFKKTTLTNLDITHEKLRMQIFLSYELGYFRFKDGKQAEKGSAQIERKRFTAISGLVDELGKMIGAWIKKIKDVRFVDVMMMFADMGTPVGIPIGNLLSQIYALIYMNPVDHFIKRVLKVKHYVRYVDDFILIGITRDQCLCFREKIIQFIKENLGLRLSKSTIQKVRKGLNFVGYRTWKSKKFIRKHSLYKFRRMVKKGNQESAVSILGHAKHTNSLPYMITILRGLKNDFKIPKNYRQFYNPHPA